MNLRYHQEASHELDEVYRWYETQQSGLGTRFISELEASINRIQNFPYIGNVIVKDIRRALLPDFPYGVMYSIKDDMLEIVAVAHLHRKPFYWKNRKPGI